MTKTQTKLKGALLPELLGKQLMLAGMLLFSFFINFQLRLPTATNAITVNFADPIAFVIGVSFFAFWYLQPQKEPLWQHRLFGTAIMLAGSMVIYGWISGFIQFGSNHWAIFNRLSGLIIVFSYLMTGCAVAYFLSWQGIYKSVILIVVTSIITAFIQVIIVPFIPHEATKMFSWQHNSFLNGFLQDRNAFALLLMTMLCFLLFNQKQTYHWNQLQNWFIAALAVMIVITQSRMGIGLLVVILIFYYMQKHLVLVRLLPCAAIFFTAFITVNLYVHKLIAFCYWSIIQFVHWSKFLPGKSSLTTFEVFQEKILPTKILGVHRETEIFKIFDRYEGYAQALKLWREQPILGRGLGSFIEQYPLVIHNVPLWILTEMGLVGLLLVLPLPLVIAHHIFKDGFRKLSSDRTIFLACMLVFCGFSMTHDVSYQRIIWYILGVLMCCGMVADKFKGFHYSIGK